MSVAHFAWNPQLRNVGGEWVRDPHVTMHAWQFGGSGHVMVREQFCGLWSEPVRVDIPEHWRGESVATFLAALVGTRRYRDAFRSEEPFRIIGGMVPVRVDSPRVLDQARTWLRPSGVLPVGVTG